MSDRYEPTSHEYLYEIDREQLFAMFAGAVASLRVDSDGVHCLSAEAQAVSRMARAVQERTVDGTPRQSKLGGLATVTRVLLSRTDSRDRGGEEPEWHMPLDELVAYFLNLRAKLGDFLPATSPVPVPDGVPAGFIESLRDGANPDGSPGVWADADGRLWTGLPPGDEEWSDEQLAALPPCAGCGEPMVPGVEHSGCRRRVS
jgi:hypothetical protein